MGLQIFCKNNSQLVKDLLTCDNSFVIVAALKASNNMGGQHSIAVFNGGIYDVNCQFVMKKTQKALDWCCGDGNETCTGIDWSYQLLPKHHKEIAEDMRFTIQTRNKKDCNVRGRVAGTKGKLPQLQFVDGLCCYVSLKN